MTVSARSQKKSRYQEYVESFAHEIKIPIGALSLTFDNAQNHTLQKETDKIFRLVEQMLYYARSENKCLTQRYIEILPSPYGKKCSRFNT